ncbi:glycosyltransferase [Nonomuraea typhae]|uniref:glycosyltransferase n=1 Tax=Nonomuraea typhae TaxID=2603600 RepID=UPI0012F97A86|nr:glycosyltransferase [Nonomuraea typhae]
MNILLNAGPWLAVPPPGYGGIENVVATLVPALRARGVRVVLATVGASTVAADEVITVFPEGQFADLQKPYNQVMGLAHAHQARVAAELRRRRDIDLVHDHLEVVGPAVLAALGGPPVLHTLHWDLCKHPAFYGSWPQEIAVNGVSHAQLARAPAALRAAAVGVAHLATPLAERCPRFPLGEHVVVMGRVCPLKGQHVAARLCQKLGLPLVLAGPVSGLGTPAELARVLDDPAHPLHGHPDVRYHRDQVMPYLDGDLVRWVGAIGGAARDELYGSARAALFPLQWAEPGGTAVVEALALGVPPVGLRRGCLPELVEHGRTGFLAATEEELAACLLRAGELDPEDCRAAARARFTPSVMAERYLELYAATRARRSPRPGPP